MGRTPGTDAGLVQRVLPAASVERTEGIHGFPSIDVGTMASQRVRFARWEHGPDALPPRVQDTPGMTGFLMVVRHQRGSYRIECFLIIGYEDNGLMGQPLRGASLFINNFHFIKN